MKSEKNLIQPEPKDLSSASGALPNLHLMTASKLPLDGAYWTPSLSDPIKLVIILGFENSEYLDSKTGETIGLRCVCLVEQKQDLTLVKWLNGSCKLVSTLETALKNGSIQAGSTALKIQYHGKLKTKSGNFIDDFSVRILSAEMEEDDANAETN